MTIIQNLINNLYIFDIAYLIITIISLLKCTKQGFILSIIAASKWLFAYVITLFLFPKLKPFVNDLIDNEYVLDLILGLTIFIIVIFLILLINKGIGRAIKYTGLGSLDRMFGFFFGFLRSYIIEVCIFTTIDIVYNHERWPDNLTKSVSFQWVEKGSKYLINEFPSKKDYEDTKKKIEDI